jgi:hypothetical protein
MVTNALKAMTHEQREEYKKIGEHMYGTVNFEDTKILTQMNPPMAESVAYVEEGIKSGLLACDLSEDEVILLSKVYGEKWYERYGFKQNEVSEDGLSLKVKKEIDAVVKNKIDDALSKRNKKV